MKLSLIHPNGWGMVTDNDGVLFHVMDRKGQGKGYFRATASMIDEVSEKDYFVAKYGTGYNSVMGYFKDNITDSILLDNGDVFVSFYQESTIHKFDKDGNLIWKNETMGDFDTIYGIAYENNSIWCTYPTRHTIKKFSFDTDQQGVSIGDDEGTIFNYPESVVVNGDFLYVCDMGNYRICRINLSSYKVDDYTRFSEPVWEYVQVNGEEFVKLDSGIYLLESR